MLFAFLPAALGRVLFLALHLSPSRFPQPLSPRQEAAAFAAMVHGDAAARDRLIRHNLRLVAHIAKKYYAADTPEDLISTGSIGLIKAVNTFDPARGIKFSTYASRCIENEMRMQFRRQRRVPPMVSLQEPLEAGQDGGLTLMDAIPDDVPLQESLEQRDLARRLSARLSRLPARERQVLALRYGLGGAAPHTQLQVAQKLGLSRSYISRLESRGLSLLKKL